MNLETFFTSVQEMRNNKIRISNRDRKNLTAQLRERSVYDLRTGSRKVHKKDIIALCCLREKNIVDEFEHRSPAKKYIDILTHEEERKEKIFKRITSRADWGTEIGVINRLSHKVGHNHSNVHDNHHGSGHHHNYRGHHGTSGNVNVSETPQKGTTGGIQSPGAGSDDNQKLRSSSPLEIISMPKESGHHRSDEGGTGETVEDSSKGGSSTRPSLEGKKISSTFESIMSIMIPGVKSRGFCSGMLASMSNTLGLQVTDVKREKVHWHENKNYSTNKWRAKIGGVTIKGKADIMDRSKNPEDRDPTLLILERMVEHINKTNVDVVIESDKDLVDYDLFLRTHCREWPTWRQRHKILSNIITVIGFYCTAPLFYCSWDDPKDGVCSIDASNTPGGVNAFYYASATLTTVGFGDVSPSTDSAKLFTVLYIFVGLGLVANALMEAMGEFLEYYAEKQEQKSKAKQGSGFIEDKPEGFKPKSRLQGSGLEAIASNSFVSRALTNLIPLDDTESEDEISIEKAAILSAKGEQPLLQAAGDLDQGSPADTSPNPRVVGISPNQGQLKVNTSPNPITILKSPKDKDGVHNASLSDRSDTSSSQRISVGSCRYACGSNSAVGRNILKEGSHNWAAPHSNSNARLSRQSSQIPQLQRESPLNHMSESAVAPGLNSRAGMDNAISLSEVATNSSTKNTSSTNATQQDQGFPSHLDQGFHARQDSSGNEELGIVYRDEQPGGSTMPVDDREMPVGSGNLIGNDNTRDSGKHTPKSGKSGGSQSTPPTVKEIAEDLMTDFKLDKGVSVPSGIEGVPLQHTDDPIQLLEKAVKETKRAQIPTSELSYAKFFAKKRRRVRRRCIRHCFGETHVERKVTWLAYTKIVQSFLLVFLPVCLGALIVGLLEEWSFVDSLYWATVSTTTVGYGDLLLLESPSRYFCIFYLLFGVVAVSAALTNLASLRVDVMQRKKEFEFESRTLTPELLAEMDTNGDGVDEFEFVVGTLIALDKVHPDDLLPIFRKFKELDSDGSGVLTKEDLLCSGKETTRRRDPYDSSAENSIRHADKTSGSTRGASAADVLMTNKKTPNKNDSKDRSTGKGKKARKGKSEECSPERETIVEVASIKVGEHADYSPDGDKRIVLSFNTPSPGGHHLDNPGLLQIQSDQERLVQLEKEKQEIERRLELQRIGIEMDIQLEIEKEAISGRAGSKGSNISRKSHSSDTLGAVNRSVKTNNSPVKSSIQASGEAANLSPFKTNSSIEKFKKGGSETVLGQGLRRSSINDSPFDTTTDLRDAVIEIGNEDEYYGTSSRGGGRLLSGCAQGDGSTKGSSSSSIFGNICAAPVQGEMREELVALSPGYYGSKNQHVGTSNSSSGSANPDRSSCSDNTGTNPPNPDIGVESATGKPGSSSSSNQRRPSGDELQFHNVGMGEQSPDLVKLGKEDPLSHLRNDARNDKRNDTVINDANDNKKDTRMQIPSQQAHQRDMPNHFREMSTQGREGTRWSEAESLNSC